MLCIEVTSSDGSVCTAGLAEWGIISASISSGTHIGVPPRPGFELSVNGIDGDTIVEWSTRSLFLNDWVTIRVVDSEPEVPVRRLSDPEFEGLAKAKGLAHARGLYRFLKRRLSEVEAEYGHQLLDEKDA